MNKIKRLRKIPIGFKVIDLKVAIWRDPAQEFSLCADISLVLDVVWACCIPAWLDRTEISAWEMSGQHTTERSVISYQLHLRRGSR